MYGKRKKKKILWLVNWPVQHCDKEHVDRTVKHYNGTGEDRHEPLGQTWWHTSSSLAIRRYESLRLAWSTYQVPDYPGLHIETHFKSKHKV